MAEFTIDAQLFKEMVITAANNLEHNKQLLNDLNVFPVPDGDTGTNMCMTIVSAARQVNACTAGAVGAVMHELSNGALKGARGNSGVILSQLFRGFAQSADKTKQTLDAEDFAKAIRMGVDAAYKAVMKPKEGTILTVAKAMAVRAEELTEQNVDLYALLDGVIEAADEMLKKTPEMLPVLKEAGVVDAGGAGLLAIYKGFKMAMDGEEVVQDLDLSIPEEERKLAAASAMDNISTAEIEFGYCTEFFIMKEENDISAEAVDRLRDKLLGIGDSLVVVGTEDLVKVHVHTNVPGRALQYALRLGQLSKIKIENMREQHTALIAEAAPVPQKEMKELAIVAVAAGEGLEHILKEFGVDEIVEGGQSMNPSIEDIRKAIEQAPSENVIVLPNNKNIILAAEQAGALLEKNVAVIPTRSFPQGLDAVLAFNATLSLADNAAEMTEASKQVKTGEITYAVRDTHVNGFEIHEGDILGLEDGDIVVCGTDAEQTLKDLVAHMVDLDESSVIALYYGKDADADAAEAIAEQLGTLYEDCDVEVYSGGQDIYRYIISVE